VEALHAPAIRWVDAVVVDLVEVDLDARHVLVVAVRWVRRPVTRRCVHLDAQQALGLAGVDDMRYLPLCVVTAADLGCDVVGRDEPGRERARGWRPAYAD